MGIWRTRVQAELDELSIKANKLGEFMSSPDYLELSNGHRALMLMQSHSMLGYYTALEMRLLMSISEEES